MNRAHSSASDIRRVLGLASALLFLIAAMVGLDLISDRGEGVATAHVVIEAGAAALALLGGSWLAVWVRRLSVERDAARSDAARQRAEAARWRGEAEQALRGLGEAIDVQLARWALTDAEREVALLLLKGLSTKEIAAVRGVSDRTIRQQAATVYQKAGLQGRADLSAFFLEDLLLPAAKASP